MVRSDVLLLEETRHFAAMTKILIGLLDGTVTLHQLSCVISTRAADLKGEASYVSDIADLCSLPSSTRSSMVARLSDVTANGIGLIALESDAVDRRKKLVRPSRMLSTLAKVVARVYRAFTQWEKTL